MRADNFDQLPGKYQWEREETLDVINRWSSKYLGVLSSIADRCEVLDIQAHGYFVWNARMVVEKREWAEHRKGINVPNPSGLLEFLKHKPPKIPKLSSELAERLDEICPNCHGAGEYVCPECFGQGEVQCPECRGVGKLRFADGTYDTSQCEVCRGARKLPCTACKGVPERLCEVCGGSGVVVVYPAIAISRSSVEKRAGTSVSGVSRVGNKYTIPVATLGDDAIEVPKAAETLLDRFEGADKLRIAYVPKDKKARITDFNVDIRWYPYILCRMKNNSTGRDFVIGINCVRETVFLVSGKCPRGKGLWALLLGWANSPFDKNMLQEEIKFMLKQLKQGEGADAEGTGQGVNRDDAASARKG